MSEHKGLEEIASFARSPNRVRILTELSQDGSLRRREISARVDVSRTTLGRNLDYLVEEGWVAVENREYSITSTGEWFVDDFIDLVETVNSAKRIQPFLEIQPLDELGLDVQVLKDAEITFSTRSDPYAPVRRHVDAVSSTERFRVLLPSVGLDTLKSAKERIHNGETRHEVVVNSEVAENFRSKQDYADVIQSLSASECVDIRVSNREIPCFIGILDESVQIGANNEQGIPRALLETESDEAREWAKGLFLDFRERASPFSIN